MTVFDSLWQSLTVFNSFWHLWQILTVFYSCWQFMMVFDSFQQFFLFVKLKFRSSHGQVKFFRAWFLSKTTCFSFNFKIFDIHRHKHKHYAAIPAYSHSHRLHGPDSALSPSFAQQYPHNWRVPPVPVLLTQHILLWVKEIRKLNRRLKFRLISENWDNRAWSEF